MAGDYKNQDNKALFGLLDDNNDNHKDSNLSEKRKKAGKKGGNAPHRCRGRGCNNKNKFSSNVHENNNKAENKDFF